MFFLTCPHHTYYKGWLTSQWLREMMTFTFTPLTEWLTSYRDWEAASMDGESFLCLWAEGEVSVYNRTTEKLILSSMCQTVAKWEHQKHHYLLNVSNSGKMSTQKKMHGMTVTVMSRSGRFNLRLISLQTFQWFHYRYSPFWLLKIPKLESLILFLKAYLCNNLFNYKFDQTKRF